MVNPKYVRPRKDVGKTKTIICPECDGSGQVGFSPEGNSIGVVVEVPKSTTCVLCKGKGKIQGVVTNNA